MGLVVLSRIRIMEMQCISNLKLVGLRLQPFKGLASRFSMVFTILWWGEGPSHPGHFSRLFVSTLHFLDVEHEFQKTLHQTDLRVFWLRSNLQCPHPLSSHLSTRHRLSRAETISHFDLHMQLRRILKVFLDGALLTLARFHIYRYGGKYVGYVAGLTPCHMCDSRDLARILSYISVSTLQCN